MICEHEYGPILCMMESILCFKLEIIIVCKKQLVGTIFRTNIQARLVKSTWFCFPLSGI